MPDTLPAEFADLEPFADWAIPTERARYAKRISATMDELQSFYDAAFPRMEDALVYLEHFSVDELPEDAKRLLKAGKITLKSLQTGTQESLEISGLITHLLNLDAQKPLD